jgi:hypothetical protein
MYDSVVIELQALASDSKSNLLDVLRKALLVATKLNLDSFREWIERELHGYGQDGQVPKYRRAYAELKADNPYHGQVPFIINDERVLEKLCVVEMREPIANVLDLLNSDSPTFELTLSPGAVEVLMRIQNSYAPLYPIRVIARSEIAGIPDAVRTTVLEWALRLEREGIVGEGISFSRAERELAASSSQITITNFQGVFGNVSNSSVTQNLEINVRRKDFDSLKAYLERQGIEQSDLELLEVAIRADDPPTSRNFGARVSEWFANMMGKAAQGSWLVSLETAGNLLSTALWAYYGRN